MNTVTIKLSEELQSKLRKFYNARNKGAYAGFSPMVKEMVQESAAVRRILPTGQVEPLATRLQFIEDLFQDGENWHEEFLLLLQDAGKNF